MADVKISALTATITVAGIDIFPVVQGGATKKITFANAISSLGIATGTGTTGKIAKFTNGLGGVIGDSIISESGNALSIAGYFTSTLSQNGTTLWTFVNTDTTDTNSRAYIDLTAGNRMLRLQAINGDHLYIDRTSTANLYFTENGVSQGFFAGTTGVLSLTSLAVENNNFVKASATGALSSFNLFGTANTWASGQNMTAVLNVRGTTSGVASVATVYFRDSNGVVNSYVGHANGGMYIYTASGTNTAITIGTNELDAIGINGSTQHITLPGVPSGRAAVSTGEVFKDTAANITASSDLFLAVKV